MPKKRESLSAQAHNIKKETGLYWKREKDSYGIQEQEEHSNLSFRGILIQLRKTGRTDSIVQCTYIQYVNVQ